MGSFPEQARRVRDPQRPLAHRLWALRECALRFAPYGFHATWHHLVVATPIPQRLTDDPESLRRAVDELDAARRIVLPHVEAYQARRRREKAAGRRLANPAALGNSLGWTRLAFCPDLEHHPAQPLPVVVRRVVDAWLAGRAGGWTCAVCGTDRDPHRACPRCGVHPDGMAAHRPRPRRRDEAERWRLTWKRSIPH